MTGIWFLNFIFNISIIILLSCLFKELMDLPESIETVILYSVTCAGQNKNFYVAVMSSFLLQKKKSIQEIHHKFFIPRHTRIESDADHSAIEKEEKKKAKTVFITHMTGLHLSLC